MVADTLASLRRSRPAHHLRVIRQRLGIAPVRSEQPYATHVPVLIALGHELRIRRVLELGTGEHSTACFLDTDVFPHLECLVSVENDPLWAERTRVMFERDDRATLHVATGAMSDALADLQPAVGDFDLVFCDDSTNAADRSRTIGRVASLCSPASVVVIHDFEVPAYQEAAAFPHRTVFKAFYPNTGVCWSAAAVDAATLRRHDRTIARSKSRTPLTDRRAWATALSG